VWHWVKFTAFIKVNENEGAAIHPASGINGGSQSSLVSGAISLGKRGYTLTEGIDIVSSSSDEQALDWTFLIETW